jgi:hypothetical protein
MLKLGITLRYFLKSVIGEIRAFKLENGLIRSL